MTVFPDRLFEFQQIEGDYSICVLPPGAALPSWASGDGFCSLTRTDDELSVVCKSESVPADVVASRDWIGLRIAGTLQFSETGVLSSLTKLLAERSIPVFVISTYQTDYLFVRRIYLDRTITCLSEAGHTVIASSTKTHL